MRPPTNLKDARECALTHLGNDDPRGAMRCLLPHVNEPTRVAHIDDALALIQATTNCTSESVRAFIERLPSQ